MTFIYSSECYDRKACTVQFEYNNISMTNLARREILVLIKGKAQQNQIP